MSAFNLIEAGVNLVTSRRDRDHAENTADRNYARSRSDYLADRKYDEAYLSRLVKGAKDAGLHPLAALGVQTSGGPAFSGPSSSTSSPRANLRMRDRSSDAVNAAQARNLDAQTDLVKHQTAAAKLGLAKNASLASQDKQGRDLVNPQRHRKIDALGFPLDVAPTTDAESLESRYGELAGALLGAGNFPIDVAQTLVNKINRYLKKRRNK